MAQCCDALRQLRRLVVDRNDDLDIERNAAGIDVGFERSQGCHVRHGAGAVSGLREARLWIRCEKQMPLHGTRPDQETGPDTSSGTTWAWSSSCPAAPI